MAVPSILIVAPKGIVKEDTSLETPSSDIFSKFRGIVAFDVEDENDVNGHFFLLLDPESFHTLFSKLGVSLL